MKKYRPIVKNYYGFSPLHVQNARDDRAKKLADQYRKALYGKKKLKPIEQNQLLLFRDN